MIQYSSPDSCPPPIGDTLPKGTRVQIIGSAQMRDFIGYFGAIPDMLSDAGREAVITGRHSTGDREVTGISGCYRAYDIRFTDDNTYSGWYWSEVLFEYGSKFDPRSDSDIDSFLMEGGD